MVKITAYKQIASIKTPIKGKVALGQNFDINTEPEIGEANTSANTSSIQNLNILTGLQEIGDAGLRHKIEQKGQSLLAGLDQLQNEIMNDGITSDTLRSLQQNLSTDQDLIDSSPLSGVVREIKQRVAVELAKVEVAKKILSSSGK